MAKRSTKKVESPTVSTMPATSKSKAQEKTTTPAPAPEKTEPKLSPRITTLPDIGAVYDVKTLRLGTARVKVLALPGTVVSVKIVSGTLKNARDTWRSGARIDLRQSEATFHIPTDAET